MTDLEVENHRRTGTPLRVAGALAFLILALAAPITHPGADQQASRYALTAALWDYQTFEVSRYDKLLARDRSVRDGVVYSDKAPLQPVLAVPAYGVYRAVGGPPAEDLAGPTGWFDYGLWWVTFWSAAVPGALVAALMYLWARKVELATALIATIGLTAGSLLLVYSSLLFGHVLGALAIFGMFLLVRREELSNPLLLAAGALGGAAVLIEYPLVLPVAVITAAGFAIHRWRASLIVLAGLPFAALLAAYNWALFGSPWTLSYQWTAFFEPPEEAVGTLEIFTGPSIDRFLGVLLSPRGLLVATPVLIVGLLGFFLMWRKGWRVDVIVPLLVFASLLGVQLAWGSSFAGGAGPRYVTPALPFLVAPLAVAWRRWEIGTSLLAGMSVITMVLAVFTNPQLPSDFTSGLGHWLLLASQGLISETVFTLTLGSWGWLAHGILLVLAIAVLIRLHQRLQRQKGEGSVRPVVPARLP